MITELASFENVSCKISGMVTEAKWHNWNDSDFTHYVDHIVESFTPQRIMFGSDWPVALLATQSYSDVVQLAEKLTSQLSDSEKRSFWGGHATQKYKVTNQ
jgi:L-fuconolactonase